MVRITKSMLEGLRDAIAKALDKPNGPSYSRIGDRNVALVGKLIIKEGSHLYGNAWALCELTNELGGEVLILRAWSARDLFDLMDAYLRGVQDARARP